MSRIPKSSILGKDDKMSHEISISRLGVAQAAYALNPAWHNLGITTETEVSVEELYALAGLGETVETAPVYQLHDGVYKVVPGRMLIRRAYSGNVTGIASEKYPCFQDSELLDIAKEVFGDAKIGECAFSMFDGAKTVLVLNLGKDSIKVGKKEDEHSTYLLLSTGHTGDDPILALGTDVRVVCNNTYTLALSDGKGKAVKIRHSGKQSERVAELVAALKEIRHGHAQNFDNLRKLTKQKLNKEKRMEYFGQVVDTILPLKVSADMVLAAHEADKKTANPSLRERRRDDLLNDILNMYTFETEQNGLNGDNAYTVFQSVSDAIEHVVVNARGSDIERAENMFVSRTEGKGQLYKAEAMSLLDQILAAA